MAAEKTYKYFIFYLILLLTATFLLGTLIIYHQGINLDEGNYLYASRLFFEGQKPYRDFFFDKLPLLLVSFGLPQKFLASGLFYGRWYAFCYFFATLIITIYLAYRLGGERAALISGLFLGTRIFILIGGCLVSTYPPSMFFFTLSLFFIFSSLKPTSRWFWSFFTLSLAIQVRHLYLVAITLYLTLAYGEKKLSFKKLFLVTFTAFLLSSLWLIPIFYQATNIYHNLLGIYTYSPSSNLPDWLAFLKAKRYWFFDSLKNYYPELLAGLVVLIFYFRTSSKRFWQHPHTFLGSLILLLIVVSLKTNYSYSAHNLIAAPAIAILLALSIGNLFKRYKKWEVLGWLGLLILVLFSNWQFLNHYKERSGSLFLDVKTIGQMIEKNTNAEDQIIAFNTEYLIETNRYSLPGMAYSVQGLSKSYSDSRCEELHLINLNLLLANLKSRKPKLIEINDYRYNEMALFFGEDGRNQIKESLKANYRILTRYPDNDRLGQYYYLFIAKH